MNAVKQMRKKGDLTLKNLCQIVTKLVGQSQ